MHEIDATLRRAFERDGFVVLEAVIDTATLAMLREECDEFVARTDRWLAERPARTLTASRIAAVVTSSATATGRASACRISSSAGSCAR